MLRAVGAVTALGFKKALCQSYEFTPSILAPALTNAIQHYPTGFGRIVAAWSQSRLFAAAAQPERVPEEVEDNIKTDGKMFTEGFIAPHPGLKIDTAGKSYLLMHPVYSKDYVESVQPKHEPVKKVHQVIGFYAIQSVRRVFDFATGYGPDMDEKKWLRRIIFLETVAGVPGMAAGVLRHLKSLRTMQRDHGWIHTLLEEAENERMHLLTFLKLRNPGWMFRSMVVLTQGIFFNAYFVAYLLHPPTCHAMVGYLEEEAVKTYTHCLKDIDEGNMKAWQTEPAPGIAIDYWKLPETATMRDLILAVRADEACHSHVNHKFSLMKPNEDNPFTPGSHQVP